MLNGTHVGKIVFTVSAPGCMHPGGPRRMRRGLIPLASAAGCRPSSCRAARRSSRPP
jgi:hypothetical protein